VYVHVYVYEKGEREKGRGVSLLFLPHTAHGVGGANRRSTTA